jgi:hypothetical protein
MESIYITPAAVMPSASVVPSARLRTPSLPAVIGMSWRRVPALPGAHGGAVFTHVTTANAAKQADRNAAKQASPPRGTG